MTLPPEKDSQGRPAARPLAPSTDPSIADIVAEGSARGETTDPQSVAHRLPATFPDLSPHHTQILFFLAQHRFATTKQLARLSRHHYKSHTSARRQTNRQLNLLMRHKLVTRLERRIGGWRGGADSFVWTLTGTASRLLGSRSSRFRSSLLSTEFLSHLLAITEAHVQILEALTGTGWAHHVQVEPHCWRTYMGSFGSPVTLRPDLHVHVTSPDYEDRYFIEIDRATENPARVVATCHRYQEYYTSGAEQDASGMFPLVVWLVPHDKRQRQLTRYIADDPRLQRNLFTVITTDQITNLVRDGPPEE